MYGYSTAVQLTHISGSWWKMCNIKINSPIGKVNTWLREPANQEHIYYKKGSSYNKHFQNFIWKSREKLLKFKHSF